jgi:hypothetical protein
MILRVQKCEHEVEMKTLIGQTDLWCFAIILENAAGREKDAQDIGVHSEIKKFVVTLLVMRSFLILLGALRACADFRDPTAFSRIMGEETWAGICSRKISTNAGQSFPKLQEPSHVSSSQQYPR